MMKTLAIAVLCGLILACGPVATPPIPAPPASLISGEIALPTAKPVSLPADVPEACGGVGLQAVLRGDAHDRRVAWLVNDLGTRVDVTWPPGYRARFVPGLEVLDAAGAVVLRDGDPVTGACTTEDPDVLHMEPPFK